MSSFNFLVCLQGINAKATFIEKQQLEILILTWSDKDLKAFEKRCENKVPWTYFSFKGTGDVSSRDPPGKHGNARNLLSDD